MSNDVRPNENQLAIRRRRLTRVLSNLFTPASARSNFHLDGFARRASEPAIPDGRRAHGISVLLHLFAVGMLLSLPTSKLSRGPVWELLDQPPIIYHRRMLLPPQSSGEKSGGGGAGGQHEAEPPTRGSLPPFASIQLVPPTPRIKNPNPALHSQPTVLGPEELAVPNPPFTNIGNPMELLVNFSAGPGSRAGLGRGTDGTGIGDKGSGGGYLEGERWGTGGGRPGSGRRTIRSEATCRYCPSPKYSEEARKSKYAGVVLLAVVVTPEGKATNIRVLKGVGLGLDEQAIEAVKDWQFNPATGLDGRPVASEVTIQVDFRLL